VGKGGNEETRTVVKVAIKLGDDDGRGGERRTLVLALRVAGVWGPAPFYTHASHYSTSSSLFHPHLHLFFPLATPPMVSYHSKNFTLGSDFIIIFPI
jgi:hypothetical protein